jgi:uncharacterized protein YlxW (UPF0749 family)
MVPTSPWRRPALGHLAAGGVCALAGLLFAISADTAGGTDLRPERGDLTELVRAEQDRIASANTRVRALQEEVQARTDEVAAQNGAPDQEELVRQQRRNTELARLTGLAPVRGPGLTVVLDDAPASARQQAGPDVSPDDLVVHQQDVQAVVNALWAGGAEALQLMDQRVISTSAVRCVGSTLLLQGRIYPPPYRITAIGPVGPMRDALDVAPAVGVYRQYVDLVGLRYDVSTEAEVTLPAYDGSLGVSAAAVPSAPSRTSDGSPTARP